MGRFHVALHSRHGVQECFARLFDLAAHDRLIPLTSVRAEPPSVPLAEGARFIARTGLGPLGFDDPMEVVVWRPPGPRHPGRATIVKHGRVITGRIDAIVTAREGSAREGTAREETAREGSAGSTVYWTQQIGWPWLPTFLDRPVTFVARLAYARMLRRLV